MVMFNNIEELVPGIVSYKNVMEDTDGFIKKIEDLIDSKILIWYDAHQSSGPDDKSKIEKSSRNCLACSLPSYRNQKPIQEDEIYKLSKYIDSQLLPVYSDYVQKYSANHWPINEGWQLLKYGANNYFVNHYDDSKQYPRTISTSFYLNDDFEGGEIEFPRFNLKIKPTKNQMIMFPANYVYNHIVHPVTSGIRYTVVGWWN